MIEFLYKLFIGHNHQYAVLEHGAIVRKSGSTSGVYYVLQCSHCGKIKHRNCQAPH